MKNYFLNIISEGCAWSGMGIGVVGVFIKPWGEVYFIGISLLLIGVIMEFLE